ncbi:MAG TPA: peptidoglycan DD-metalloendopeptidase family protein [Stellaceae bacterium]|nr:peptidoglycan DD-metalloendopeptidase family protein [Stellaceae bacterium]
MIGLRRRVLFAIVALVLLPSGGGNAAAPKAAPVEAQAAQLETVREQCVAAALTVRRRERTIGALDLAVDVMERAVTAKQQELAQSRQEQEQLLGALARLARAPPEALAFAPEGPVDRLRSGVLIAAAVPALTDQARSLTGQLAALNTVRSHITTRRKEVDEARAALAASRDALIQLIARRSELDSQLLRGNGKTPAGAKLAEHASDLLDLVRRADAEMDRHDKELLIRLRTTGPVKKGATPLDPTKPKSLRSLDAPKTTMLWPVAGDLVHGFGDADSSGHPSPGLTLNTIPNALVIAPFDGRVDFAGQFQDYGLILIIRHGGGYHSLLAGLSRVDVTIGQWLLAGEPVGVLAGADDKNAGATFYLELRHDGRPVDPQSRLASRDEKTEDSRVSE